MNQPESTATRRDLAWLGLGVVLLVASGIGWRHPWPADEPGFVQVAHEMASRGGDWLFPSLGGELYDDKPPAYFWLLAGGYALGHSTRWTFLLPSLASALVILALVYDFVRRTSGRREGLAAAALLLVSIQFVLQTRSAQIDATLCLLTTLSLYALLRHVMLGPAWGWYFLSGLAAGLGVITKGVGFLPLLALVPYFILRARGFQPLPHIRGGARWGLAGAGLLFGIGIWVVPMLLAVARSRSPALLAYRDAILWRETATRYFAPWHHFEPWYFFLLEVIPPLWIPFSALGFWLVPRFRQAWSKRDARVWLPLAWVLMVLVFFSASPGKRGVYLFPALPAVALACAPGLSALLARHSVERLGIGLAVLVTLGSFAFAGAYLMDAPSVVAIVRSGDISVLPLVLLPLSLLAALLITLRWRPLLAWPATLVVCALVFSWTLEPEMDPSRSGRAFMTGMLTTVPRGIELGLVEYKYQFLLYLDRPVVDFGHRRWIDALAEQYDAAHWLDAAPKRALLVPQSQIEPCFARAPRRVIGESAGATWLLVSAPAEPNCAVRGDPARALSFAPPTLGEATAAR